MTRKSKRNTPSVSLFPFLTVLISTMGVLIMMLVIGVQSAQSRAKKEAAAQEEKISEQIDELKAGREMLQIRSEGWLSKREELLENSMRVRQQRDFLVSEINQLKTEQADLASQFAALEAPDDLTPEAQFDDEALEKEIRELEDEITTKLADDSGAPVVYSVVPYEGAGGTRRRPIYIECLADRILLQPLGIELRDSDFPDELAAGNVLDVALSTIRQYWIENKMNGSEGDPYPLLIVRPEGSGAYSLARRAMVNWADEFGYELVGAGLKLDFGDVDSELAARVQLAVEMARRNVVHTQRQKQKLAETFRIQQQSSSGNASVGLQVDRVNGGFKLPSQLAPLKNNDQFTQVINGTNAVKTSVSASTARQPTDLANDGASLANSRPPSAVAGARSEQLNNDDSLPGQLGSAVSGSKAVDSNASTQSSNSTHDSSTAVISKSNSGGNLAAGNSSGNSSLAAERGENWAIPTSTVNKTAYVRPIRVYCSQDALIVVPESIEQEERTVIRLDNNAWRAVDELVATVQKRIQTWGPAPENGYWKPSVNFQLLPGGEPHIQAFKTVLAGSGLDLKSE